MIRTIKFLFFTLSTFFAIIYLLVVAYVYFNQSEMVFKATKLASDFKFDYNNDFEEVNFPSFDGENLHGLLFKAQNSKGLVFYLHGNAGNLSTWGNISEIYTDLGYDIYILDYRGFGKSNGNVESEEQVHKDVSLVYRNVIKKYDQQKIVIIGYSIGTGLASYLASNNHADKLILQAPFYNFTTLSEQMVPFMPNFLKKFSFKTNTLIPKIKCPIYIFHGNKDQLISYENSVRLSKLLKPNDLFFTLENQNHIGINENEDYQQQLKLILEK